MGKNSTSALLNRKHACYFWEGALHLQPDAGSLTHDRRATSLPKPWQDAAMTPKTDVSPQAADQDSELNVPFWIVLAGVGVGAFWALAGVAIGAAIARRR